MLDRSTASAADDDSVVVGHDLPTGGVGALNIVPTCGEAHAKLSPSETIARYCALWRMSSSNFPTPFACIGLVRCRCTRPIARLWTVHVNLRGRRVCYHACPDSGGNRAIKIVDP